MATMNVSLPDPMKKWVNDQAEAGRYGNASDYVRDLIRKDQGRQEKMTELRALIDEGLSSGISDKSMADIRKEVIERLSKNGKLPA